jgi:hypothetical protein
VREGELAFSRQYPQVAFTHLLKWGDSSANWRRWPMDLTTISAQLEKYENKWVAIDESEEKIVGVGDDAFEATEDAERGGYQDTILFKVPSFDAALIRRIQHS